MERQWSLSGCPKASAAKEILATLNSQIIFAQNKIPVVFLAIFRLCINIYMNPGALWKVL
jgi:hypothetical protein